MMLTPNNVKKKNSLTQIWFCEVVHASSKIEESHPGVNSASKKEA